MKQTDKYEKLQGTHMIRVGRHKARGRLEAADGFEVIENGMQVSLLGDMPLYCAMPPPSRPSLHSSVASCLPGGPE